MDLSISIILLAFTSGPRFPLKFASLLYHQHGGANTFWNSFHVIFCWSQSRVSFLKIHILGCNVWHFCRMSRPLPFESLMDSISLTCFSSYMLFCNLSIWCWTWFLTTSVLWISVCENKSFGWVPCKQWEFILNFNIDRLSKSIFLNLFSLSPHFQRPLY